MNLDSFMKDLALCVILIIFPNDKLPTEHRRKMRKTSNFFNVFEFVKIILFSPNRLRWVESILTVTGWANLGRGFALVRSRCEMHVVL